MPADSLSGRHIVEVEGHSSRNALSSPADGTIGQSTAALRTALALSADNRVGDAQWDGDMRDLDGMRIIGPDDGPFTHNPRSVSRQLVTAADTNECWSLGEVTARADEAVATHLHPGEPEALMILEGNVELHGSHGIAHLGPGDVVFIPPDTEHGLRTPQGGRWLAIWPNRERVPGPRYAD